MPNDPYETLGLTRSATADEIKKAYRKLVRTSHPDLHPDDAGAEARFKAISAAYDILKDPETRARFDAGEIDGLGRGTPAAAVLSRFRGCRRTTPTSKGEGSVRRPIRPTSSPRSCATDAAPGRIRGPRVLGPGAPDVRYTLEVPFLDAARGAETRITLPDGQSLAVQDPAGDRGRPDPPAARQGRAGLSAAVRQAMR